MNKNVKSAKDLVKIAKNLIADEIETSTGNLDTTITVGNKKIGNDALDITIIIEKRKFAY